MATRTSTTKVARPKKPAPIYIGQVTNVESIKQCGFNKPVQHAVKVEIDDGYASIISSPIKLNIGDRVSIVVEQG